MSNGAPAGRATDEELVRRFQKGKDREAVFMELFERHGSMTFGFLRRRIGDPEVAAEINQELYISVLEALDRFRGDSSFKTWLFRMAHNRLSNLRRRWRTHLDELPESSPDELAEEVFVASRETPETEFEKEEAQRALRRCLATLPELERVVILGQYYQNVTLDEMTRELGLTNKSGARASLIAGQRKLRKCLERAGVDGPA